jgi:membrane-associated phospholipid phosphatase
LPRPANTGKPSNMKIKYLLPAGLLAALVASLAFGWLAKEVLEGETEHFDSVVRACVHRHATPELTLLMRGFSFLGSVVVVGALVLLGMCVCLYACQIRIAGLLAITVVGAAVLDYTLKAVFHRPRPVAYFGLTPSSYSFPSGHAMGSLCFYGVLAAILSARARNRSAQAGIWIFAVFMIGAIGFSRIYLGVHYPSDVIAGYGAGAVWVTAVASMDKILIDRQRKKLVGAQEHLSGQER